MIQEFYVIQICKHSDEALLLVRQLNFQPTRIQELEYINQTAHLVHTNLDR